VDFSSIQFWSDKMHIGLGIIFILFLICFVAIVVEETLLGGRRRRKAEKLARERNNNRTQHREN
jgi:hypothetical protein